MLGQFIVGAFAFAMVFSSASDAMADPVADFYQSKQLTLIVSTSPGGGYDAMARLMARHMGQFIPGHPSIIVQNMPGGGGIVTTNDVYNSSTQDGTIMGLPQRGVMIAQVTKQPGVHFDAAKLNWIGSIAAEISVAVSWHTSSVKTFQDVLNRQFIVGGAGASSDTEASPRLMNALVGTKFKIITGYPGLNEITLAMERGEVEGLADWSWPQLETRDKHFVNDHLINVLVQSALHKAPDLPNVPLAIDYIKTGADRKVGEIYFGMKELGHPVMVGPGVPMARVEALRKAYIAMGNDPAFQADAEKAEFPVDQPVPPKQISDFINLATSASPEVVGRLTTILNPRALQ